MQTVPLALEHFRRGGMVLLLDQDRSAHVMLTPHGADALSTALMKSTGIGEFLLATSQTDLMETDPGNSLPNHRIVALRRSDSFQPETPEEAAVEFAWLSGARPQVLIRALQPQDTAAFAERHCLIMVSIEELARYRVQNESALERVAEADLPTAHTPRPFRAYSFRNLHTGVEHLALVTPGTPVGDPLVRIHSECLTGDALGSLRCDCGPQLTESLRRLAASSGGVLVYMRGHEGRGIGLANKIKAYALQDKGFDTVEANRALGLPEDARDFAHAAQILRSFGYDRVRLLTNNPEKAASLERHSIVVSAVEPLRTPPNPFNTHYLATKARKFGHTL